MVGFFLHKKHDVRRPAVGAMLGSISGLPVNWTVIPLGQGGLLASQSEYQAFLKNKVSNPNLNDLC